jgi:hypothetical protein
VGEVIFLSGLLIALVAAFPVLFLLLVVGVIGYAVWRARKDG